MSDFWENFWGVFGIIVFAGTGLAIVLGLLICLSGLPSCGVNQPASAPVEITGISVSYLTESAYNNGNYDDAAMTEDAVFTVGTPVYTVVEFTIRTIADNDGNVSVKIAPRLSDPAAVSLMIQEAPTGKVESVADGDARSYELFYTAPANQFEKRTVRMILKLTPLTAGDIGLELTLSAADGALLTGDIHRAIAMPVEAGT